MSRNKPVRLWHEVGVWHGPHLPPFFGPKMGICFLEHPNGQIKWHCRWCTVNPEKYYDLRKL